VQVFVKIILIIALSTLLLGCKHNLSLQDPPQTETAYPWHDESKGGAYGIGEGWSIDILPAEYGTIEETVLFHPPTSYETTIIGAVYEWVTDDSSRALKPVTNRVEFIDIPPIFETVAETVIEPREDLYLLTPPLYDSNGNVERPGVVHKKFPIVKTREVRVIKSPARQEKRIVPVVPREGYILIEVKPARMQEIQRPLAKEKHLTREGEILPWRFPIRNPNGDIIYTFEDYGELWGFINSLK